MANVEQGSWLCWVHSGIVWFVVLVVLHSVKIAQALSVKNLLDLLASESCDE